MYIAALSFNFFSKNDHTGVSKLDNISLRNPYIEK